MSGHAVPPNVRCWPTTLSPLKPKSLLYKQRPTALTLAVMMELSDDEQIPIGGDVGRSNRGIVRRAKPAVQGATPLPPRPEAVRCRLCRNKGP
jgi:hypothetical protein